MEDAKNARVKDTSKELEHLSPEAISYIEGFVAGLEHQIRMDQQKAE